MNTLHHNSTHSRGFTLIEAIITISIAAILLAVAAPSFQAVIEKNRMVAARNDIMVNLHLARSEAVKRNRNVVLCSSTDGQTCAISSDWQPGYIMFTDINGDKSLNDPDQLLRRSQGNSELIQVFTTSESRTKITYKPDGSVTGDSNTTFTFCDQLGHAPPKAIIIAFSGRPRLADGSCSQ